MRISPKSLRTFVNVNGTLITISVIKYIIYVCVNSSNTFKNFIIMYFTYICRNYGMLYLLTNATKHKPYLSIGNAQNESNTQLKSHIYLFSTTFFDSLINVFIYNQLIEQSFSVINILYSILYFIPMSFGFEVILDFFHYWSHRMLHLNKTLYKKTHKTHHQHANPIFINAYYFSPVDLILSISIPMMLTIIILPYKLTVFEFFMISVYKQYTELAGHSGKMLAPASSFPQCIWLPRLLNIELYAEDHNSHHKLNKCNFAKRFSLWDKVFGTYNQDRNLNLKRVGGADGLGGGGFGLS
jgi:sterol desaturase/sphingolipid hydroxylase (fatty acid hydroxylase superfamily)